MNAEYLKGMQYAVLTIECSCLFFFFGTLRDCAIFSSSLSGDKWLVSCLGVLYLSKGLFYRVVPADQSFSSPDQYAGVFRFRLW